MVKILSKLEPVFYSFMRIVVGFLFFWHGFQKLFNFPGAAHEMPAHVQYIAGPIEFFGGIFIMLGLATRISAFLACGLMAFAYWMVHGPQALLPIQNRGELAVIYCFVFLVIFARGGGPLSLDNIFRKSKKA